MHAHARGMHAACTQHAHEHSMFANIYVLVCIDDVLNPILVFVASTKYSDGVLYGHTRHLGNFDECYNLQVNIAGENANIREINGKYCLVNIEYKNKRTASNLPKLSVLEYQYDPFDTSNPFWNVIEVYNILLQSATIYTKWSKII